jgi:hypothetical protein
MAWIGQTGAEKAAFTARPSRGLFGKTPFVGGTGDYRQSERDSQNALEGDPVSARPSSWDWLFSRCFGARIWIIHGVFSTDGTPC